MGNIAAPSNSVAIIAAMVTPALFILGSASLVASALVRMARVVDRIRVLTTLAYDADLYKHAVTAEQLRSSLERHRIRAHYTERSICLLYAAIVIFIATCLSIVIDRISGESISWLPEMLAIAGTLFLLAGASYMVLESKLSGRQIAEEIIHAIAHLEARNP